MRFKKRSKVEVLSMGGMPAGSRRFAKIVSGNGHSYTVRYNGRGGDSDLTVLERISRNVIWPCPPVTDIVENWIPGDIVEIDVDFSWKMATISEVLRNGYFLVRLLGSAVEVKVSKFDIRARQFWQGDKRVAVRKVSGNNGDKNTGCNQISTNHVQPAIARLKIRLNNGKFGEPNAASPRVLKRGPYISAHIEANEEVAKKFRAVEKDGRPQRLTGANQTQITEKEDSVRRMPACAKCANPSFQNGKELSDETSALRREACGDIQSSSVVRLEPTDSESVSCSVGSCSITSNDSYKVHNGTGIFEDIDGNDSDAESFCQLRHEEGNTLGPSKKVLAFEIHRLELHAYRSTMEAFHASGPLTWEQEALLTNLRLVLHISNDEHLMEVRNLISADNSIQNR